LLALLPSTAHALEHQQHLGVDPSLSILSIDGKGSSDVGAGIGIHYTYGLNDQFNLMGEANFSRVAADQQQDSPTTAHTRPADVAHVSAGVGYVLDVLQFVPYGGLLVGAYRLSGGTLDNTLYLPGVSAKLGLDYQLSRNWAVGAAGEYHLLFTKLSTYPSYLTIGLQAEYTWGF
jgi:opacity protein-like surface antigen